MPSKMIQEFLRVKYCAFVYINSNTKSVFFYISSYKLISVKLSHRKFALILLRTDVATF